MLGSNALAPALHPEVKRLTKFLKRVDISCPSSTSHRKCWRDGCSHPNFLFLCFWFLCGCCAATDCIFKFQSGARPRVICRKVMQPVPPWRCDSAGKRGRALANLVHPRKRADRRRSCPKVVRFEQDRHAPYFFCLLCPAFCAFACRSRMCSPVSFSRFVQVGRLT